MAVSSNSTRNPPRQRRVRGERSCSRGRSSGGGRAQQSSVECYGTRAAGPAGRGMLAATSGHGGCLTGRTMRRDALAASARASLARIPFFAGLDAAALERLAAGTRTRRFRRGEVIFHAGDPGDALFIIVSGEVKIALPSETGDEAIIATPAAGRRLRRARAAGRRGAVGHRDGARGHRGRRPAARQVPRADRDRAGGPRRPAGVPGRRAATAHAPCRGAPLPRHDRARGGAARPARRGSGPRRRRWRDPAPVVADPGGARLDGRLHPPEREQAARPVLGGGVVRLDREGIAIIDLPGSWPPRAARSRAGVRAVSRVGSVSSSDRGRGECRPRAAHRTGQEDEAPDASLAGAA